MTFRPNPRSDTGTMLIVTLVAIPFSMIAVGLRFLATWRSGRRPAFEDWSAFLSLAAFLAHVALATASLVHGHNRSSASIALEDPALFETGRKVFFFKLSIMALYYRVFSINRVFAKWIIGLGSVHIAWALGLSVLYAVQCRPLAKFWRPLMPGYCIATGPQVVASEIISSGLDFALVVLAMAMVGQIQMKATTKWKLRFLFGLGTFVGVIGILKVIFQYSLDTYSRTQHGNNRIPTDLECWVGTAKYIYAVYFHPLAKIPGPRVAAISNVWYGYHWLTGRYPWAVQDALRNYGTHSGDIVRIAPNEVVFIAPQAYHGPTSDMYAASNKNLETFVKTEINDFGDEHGGLVFEQDPERHRRIAKRVSPAFSARSIAAKEPILHDHMDFFISQMEVLGKNPEGVDMTDWTNWLAMDMSADLTYSRKMYQMRDSKLGFSPYPTSPDVQMSNADSIIGKSSAFLNVILGFNRYTTVSQVAMRFPLMSWLKYLVLPFSTMSSVPEVKRASRAEVQKRLNAKSESDSRDYFEQLMPYDAVEPTQPRDMQNLGQLVTQLLFAQYEALSTWYYATLYFLGREMETQKALAKEVRSTFRRSSDITAASVLPLKYLEACLLESLRLYPSSNTGLPRKSPGAVVDGVFLPKGVYCQTSFFATHRSDKYFRDPLSFRPQRWLPVDHPLYDIRFSDDNLNAFFPFSLGPRGCLGKEMAWSQGRLFIAKLIWKFDITRAPGNNVDFDRDLLAYGFFVKPQLMMRLISAKA
ncbi:Cytochrome P450 [Apiospora rasikravindrae]|uniref:Cytochrome P450 n=1 Tax=Apiospora rasikravindrae TaxID=990691 RepID=A0ABR1RPP2_9PEZI